MDGVDAVGDDKQRPGRFLGQEVSQRPAQAAGQADPLALARDERERAVDAEDRVRIVGKQTPARLVDRHVEDVLILVRNEVGYPVDGAFGGRAHCHDKLLSGSGPGSPRRSMHGPARGPIPTAAAIPAAASRGGNRADGTIAGAG